MLAAAAEVGSDVPFFILGELPWLQGGEKEAFSTSNASLLGGFSQACI